jgi:uncharacterized delta-60 repeat protein
VRFGVFALAIAMACGRVGFDEHIDAPAPACSALACLDATFGGSGVVTVSVDGVPNASFGDQAVVIQSDDRLVIVGKAGSAASSTGLIARIDETGALDPSFGSGGIAELAAGSAELIAVAVDPGGAIVVAGAAAKSCLVARLDATGAVDPVFGVIVTSLGGSICAFNGVTIDSAGRAIAGGQAFFTSFDLVAKAWLATGAPDPAFTELHYDGGHGDEFGSLAGIAPDGGLDLIGDTYDGIHFDGLLVHATSEGVLDPSFGSGGVTTLDLGDSEQILARARNPAGGIIATGATGSAAFVSRFSANGAIETATRIDLGGTDIGRGIAVLPDGRVVIGLRADGGSRLVVLDAGDAILGTFDLPIPAPDGIDDLLLDHHGRLLVLGDEGSGDIYVARVVIP